MKPPPNDRTNPEPTPAEPGDDGRGPVEVDGRVVDLVCAIDEIPGLTSVGGWAGNGDASEPQEGGDGYSVTFEVTRDEAGWRALDIITRACAAAPTGQADVVAWANDEALLFDIVGMFGADPDELAAIIRGG